MKIIIDIPDNVWNTAKEFGHLDICGIELAERVMAGIPLPKGHGRLIDASELPLDTEYSDILKASTIIEADKEVNYIHDKLPLEGVKKDSKPYHIETFKLNDLLKKDYQMKEKVYENISVETVDEYNILKGRIADVFGHNLAEPEYFPAYFNITNGKFGFFVIEITEADYLDARQQEPDTTTLSFDKFIEYFDKIVAKEKEDDKEM